MAHSYEELKKKSVAELREIAKVTDHPAVQGYTQMNKEHLLSVLCKALGIDTHAHHRAMGAEKVKIKTQIEALKAKRAEALAAHDHAQLKTVRRELHHAKLTIRRLADHTPEKPATPAAH